MTLNLSFGYSFRLEGVLNRHTIPSVISPGSIELPVRFKNNSDQPIYGPIKVEVIELKPKGAILNASNGKSSVGAVFDYSSALGDLESLVPRVGEMSAGGPRGCLGDRLRPSWPSDPKIAFGLFSHLAFQEPGPAS